jgi:hypothetical protein
VSWKSDLQLLDLDDGQRLEICCRRCGYVWYEDPCELLARPGFEFAWLDEVEEKLRCIRRGCGASVRIALLADGETEGFAGGLA